MKKITAVIPFNQQPYFERMLQPILASPLIEKVLILQREPLAPSWPKCDTIEADSLSSSGTWNTLLHNIRTEYLLLINDLHEITIVPGSMERFLDVAESTAAGIVFSDYYEEKEGALTEHPVNDYQTGSIRNDFDFGPVMVFSMPALRGALEQYGAVIKTKHAGLYDVRLKVSIDTPPFHIQEFLYIKAVKDSTESRHEEHFDYVDPRNYAAQKELEEAATQHLKNIGAYLHSEFKTVPPPAYTFPVEASVIIPIRNRKHTIADAVHSALSQETNFPFNVIVVDNHSTDGTTAVLSGLAAQNPAVKHIIPSRFDLSIGGCWNEAVSFRHCGRYAVQLDSDDLYKSPDTLQKMVDIFRRGDFAMIIGAYTLVNESLEEIAPGLIDHREWTATNGHNNALRVNGLGAPRAFDTSIIRRIGFLNVGYGEDYAIALRLSREYRIGRIYESLYLCRRWKGNTDAGLSVERRNRNDSFKDKIRTMEIMARQKLNRENCPEEWLW
jgi:GT2 family glycosyltransferase